jgi:hypothetical protein
MNTPKVRARISGFRGRIVVDICPYCKGTHYHSPSSSQIEVRLADCFKGEYILDFSTKEK